MYNVIERKLNNKTEYWIYKDSIIESADRMDSDKFKYIKRPRSDLPEGFIYCGDNNPFDDEDYIPDIFYDEYFIEKAKESYKLSNFNRVKNKIYDYALANEWQYFVTLTFDPDKVDSYDYESCVKAVSGFLNALRHKYTDKGFILAYLGVPELHKSGRYHFHFLMCGIPPDELSFSGKYSYYRHKKSKIYNWDAYDLGFTTVIKCWGSEGISKYLCKYITKSLMDQIPKGKKKYWASRNLKLPEVQKLYIDDLQDFAMQLGLESDFIAVVDFPNCNNKKYIYSLNNGDCLK